VSFLSKLSARRSHVLLEIWRETRVLVFALLILGLGVSWAAWSQINLILGAGFDVGHALPAELASRVWGRGAEQVLIFAALRSISSACS